TARRGGSPPRPEDVRMIAVGPDPSIAAEEPVERLGDANREPLHAPGEGLLVFGLDEKMQVIALDRVMRDAHAEPQTRLPEGLLEREDDPLFAQVPDGADGPQ